MPGEGRDGKRGHFLRIRDRENDNRETRTPVVRGGGKKSAYNKAFALTSWII